MALELTQVQAASNDYTEKMPVDIFFTGSPLLWLLLGMGKMMEDPVIPDVDLTPGGQRLRVVLEFDNAHTGGYNGSTVIPTSAIDIVNAARFVWTGAYASNAIGMAERLATSSDMALANLVKMKMDNIIKSIKDYLGSAIYAAATTTGKDINGLGDLFSTVTSTAYGSIAEDDMALWKANVVTTAEDISLKALQAIRAAAKVNNGTTGIPDLYVTTQAMWDGFERTLFTQARPANQKLVDAGFPNISFGGKPVTIDDNITAGYAYGLNLNFLKMKTHRDFAFTKPVWQANLEQPDNWVASCRWAGNLVTGHRKSHCLHTGLADPT